MRCISLLRYCDYIMFDIYQYRYVTLNNKSYYIVYNFVLILFNIIYCNCNVIKNLFSLYLFQFISIE